MKNIKPHFASGVVIKGFGRGSKRLGIPTANYGPEVVNNLPTNIETGIYFGWASVDCKNVHKMVMSIGWNPYFKNEQKSMETHILHEFPDDFYGKLLKVCVVGYLRPELNFSTLDDLIIAIKRDINDANNALNEPDLMGFQSHCYFKCQE